MKYEVVHQDEKKVVGITGRTGNNDPEFQKIIGGLWQDFMRKDILEIIQNKTNPCCIGLYSDYDFEAMTYNVTVGAEVNVNDNPELTEKTIPGGNYALFHVRGDVIKDVSDAWEKIWALPLERSFVADYEEYTSNEDGIADVNIYIALR